jgi:hypothetical protein
MFKEFIPKSIPISSREEIACLFRKGDFHTAVPACNKAGYMLQDFQQEIEAGSRHMVLSRRTSELLSFLYKHPYVKVQYSLNTLLRATFEANDFAGFLKQAERFKVYTDFEREIELSIVNLIEKKQYSQAEAWRRKFQEIKKLEK